MIMVAQAMAETTISGIRANRNHTVLNFWAKSFQFDMGLTGLSTFLTL